MSGFISSQYQFNQLSEVGDASGWFSGTISVSRFPNFTSGGEKIFSYDVPIGKKIIAKSLTISQNALYKSAIAAEGAQLVGTFKMYVNTVLNLEYTVQDPSFALPAMNNNNSMKTRAGLPITLFNGLNFLAGDTIEFTFTTPSGAAGIDPKLVIVSGFGMASGVAEHFEFIAPVQGTQAEQTLMTYTVPVGGFILKSFIANGYSWDRKLIAFAKLYINGQLTNEFLVQPNTEDHVASVITLPMWGMEFHQGENIEIFISDPTYYNAKYSVLLAATLSNLGGGETSSVFIS